MPPERTIENVIELPPVTVYGEQGDKSLYNRIISEMLKTINEPEDLYEIGEHFPWGEKQTEGQGDLTLRDLLSLGFSRFNPTVPLFTSLLEPSTISSVKNTEMEEASDWINYWFSSPYTKQRLENMGLDKENIEEVINRATDMEGMPWEDIVSRGDKSQLVWSTDRPKGSDLPSDYAGGWYDTELNYSFVKPVKTIEDALSRLVPKEEYQSKGIHELIHGVRAGKGKFTEKELSLMKEASDVYKELSDEEFLDFWTNEESPWRPYSYKNLPYTYGGSYSENRPGTGLRMNPEYYTSPEEIYSRIFQVRKHLNAKPGEYIDKEDLEKIKHYPAVNSLLRYIPIEKVQKLLNTLAVTEESEQDIFV